MAFKSFAEMKYKIKLLLDLCYFEFTFVKCSPEIYIHWKEKSATNHVVQNFSICNGQRCYMWWFDFRVLKIFLHKATQQLKFEGILHFWWVCTNKEIHRQHINTEHKDIHFQLLSINQYFPPFKDNFEFLDEGSKYARISRNS